MINKYRDGSIPVGEETELDVACNTAIETWIEAMDGLLLHRGIEAGMSMVRSANAFIDQTQPWKLAKDPEQVARLDAVLGSLVRALVRTAVTLSPFMPGKCDEIWSRLGGDGDLPEVESIEEHFPARISEVAGGVLFPRLET